MVRKKVYDSAVCAIGDIVVMLAMVSLLVAACIDPKVLDRRGIWSEHALAIPIQKLLLAPLSDRTPRRCGIELQVTPL
jgi:hypothetical protein